MLAYYNHWLLMEKNTKLFFINGYDQWTLKLNGKDMNVKITENRTSVITTLFAVISSIFNAHMSSSNPRWTTCTAQTRLLSYACKCMRCRNYFSVLTSMAYTIPSMWSTKIKIKGIEVGQSRRSDNYSFFSSPEQHWVTDYFRYWKNSLYSFFMINHY